MKVFISWSGDLSRQLAEELRDWLPSVLQSVKPFFTPSDIEKGARWGSEIASELQDSEFGIFCLTKWNLSKPWIMFEAGALSKQVSTSRVCPILFGVTSSELQGPLVQFQAAPFSELEMRKLITSMNSSQGQQRLPDQALTRAFDVWWPRLDERVKSIMREHSDGDDAIDSRTERDLLEEILALTRMSVNRRPRLSPTSELELVQAVEKLASLAEALADADLLHMFEDVSAAYFHLRVVMEQMPMLAANRAAAVQASDRIVSALAHGD